ncbi:hypothetical protein L484_002668 [Morus notabilis]|uniref:Uncharacterized protein n=1 Tax=Morus notabilis TaxID=981085 RepID=W9RWK0_9ROSA|nr:hypothetical protein L484_002668 [Morus notabilis]
MGNAAYRKVDVANPIEMLENWQQHAVTSCKLAMEREVKVVGKSPSSGNESNASSYTERMRKHVREASLWRFQ